MEIKQDKDRVIPEENQEQEKYRVISERQNVWQAIDHSLSDKKRESEEQIDTIMTSNTSEQTSSDRNSPGVTSRK